MSKNTENQEKPKIDMSKVWVGTPTPVLRERKELFLKYYGAATYAENDRHKLHPQYENYFPLGMIEAWNRLHFMYLHGEEALESDDYVAKSDLLSKACCEWAGFDRRDPVVNVKIPTFASWDIFHQFSTMSRDRDVCLHAVRNLPFKN